MRAADVWVYDVIKAGDFRFGKECFNGCRIKAYHSVFSLAKYFYIVYNIYKENEMLPATLHIWWNKIIFLTLPRADVPCTNNGTGLLPTATKKPATAC